MVVIVKCFSNFVLCARRMTVPSANMIRPLKSKYRTLVLSNPAVMVRFNNYSIIEGVASCDNKNTA